MWLTVEHGNKKSKERCPSPAADVDRCVSCPQSTASGLMSKFTKPTESPEAPARQEKIMFRRATWLRTQEPLILQDLKSYPWLCKSSRPWAGVHSSVTHFHIWWDRQDSCSCMGGQHVWMSPCEWCLGITLKLPFITLFSSIQSRIKDKDQMPPLQPRTEVWKESSVI